MLKETFEKQGLKYTRDCDSALVIIKDKSNQYIGLEYEITKNIVKITNVKPVKKDDAFIFVVSKEFLHGFGIRGVMDNLAIKHKDFENLFNGEFSYEIV